MRVRRKRERTSFTSISPIAGMDPLQAMVQQAVAQSLQNVFGGMSSSSSTQVPLQMFGRRSMGALQQPLQECQPRQLALLPPVPPAEHVAIAAVPAAAAVTPPREASQEAAAAPPAADDVPPRRKVRKTVDEATAAIIEAMGNKSTVVKRPAAALGEDVELGLDAGIGVGHRRREASTLWG